MAPALIDPAISALSLAARASAPAIPLPETMCYKLPFGFAGLINNIVTLYMVVCIICHRRPLFPWERLRFDSLATCLCGAWGLLLLFAYSSNFGGCLRSGNAALIMITVGKIVVGLCLISNYMIALAKGSFDQSKMNASAQGRFGDARNAGGETEGAAMADNATETEAAAESDTVEHTDVSPATECGTVTAGRESQIAKVARDPTPAVSSADPAEPPPAYEAIFRPVLPATSLFSAGAKQTLLNNMHLTDLENQHASSSRDAGTQTADLPPLSPIASTEAMSTGLTTTEPAKATPPQAPPINTVQGVVVFFLYTSSTILTLAGALRLNAQAIRTGNENAVFVPLMFMFLVMPGATPIVVRLLLWMAKKAWKAWKKSMVEEGAYTELEDVGEGDQAVGTDGGGARGREDAAGGSELVLDCEADGDIERLARSHPGVGGDGGGEIGERVSGAAEPAQAEPVAELTHATDDPPAVKEEKKGLVKSCLSIPARDGFTVLLLCGVSTWIGDFAIAAAAGNVGGLPSENLGWVLLYIVASKLPMLCI